MFRLIANAMAASLDVCAGIFIVYLCGAFFDYDVTFSDYLLGGILGVSPDIDIFYMLIRRKFVDHHQFFTHRPILMVPLAALLGMWLGGTFWATVAPLCLAWHYIHDTEGFGGSGMAWLWPFSEKYYSFVRVVDPGPARANIGQDVHLEWLGSRWLCPSIMSVVELHLAAALFGIVIGSVFSVWLGVALFVVLRMCVYNVWLFYALLQPRS